MVYSSSIKAYRLYNKGKLCNKECVHVIFDEFENLLNNEDSEIKEFLQVQRDSSNCESNE